MTKEVKPTHSSAIERKDIRVACICNMNNNFFSLVRYLRDEGFDAYLLLLNNEVFFHPSTDTFDRSYEKYCHRLKWGDYTSFITLDQNVIAKDLEEFDVIIGCGPVPAFLEKIGRQLDIFSPYGSDVYELPFYDRRPPDGSQNDLKVLSTLSKAQRDGIANTAYILNSNQIWNSIYEVLKFGGTHIEVTIPMLYLPEYNADCIERNLHLFSSFQRMKKIRESSNFVILHHSRQVWADHPDIYSRKGNERLFKGFAEFIKMVDGNPSLVAFDYGPDVSRSMELCENLGLSDRVNWIRRQRRKDILMCLYFADIGATEFENSWLVSGVNYETMAMSKPLMQFREDQLYEDLYPVLNPVINAHSPDEIAAKLFDCWEHPEKIRAIGTQGRAWLEEYGIRTGIDAFIQVIETRASR